MDPRLLTELWTSWASLLRSYAAAHGMNSVEHAVVEVGPAEIIVRVGAKWIRFTPSSLEGANGSPQTFSLTESGSVRLADAEPEEMDFAAERIIRELMFA